MAAGPQLTSGQILFQGLLNGNRECNYLGMNSIIAHYLGAKDLPLRLDHAKLLIMTLYRLPLQNLKTIL